MSEVSFKGKIFRGESFEEGIISIENRRISERKKGKVEKVSYIIPPFIEAHIHGGWGYDFQKGEFEELERELLKRGNDLAIPTLMNDSLENLKKISEIFTQYRKKRPNTIFPFLRVEGPFISEEKRGAQEKTSILKPTIKNIEKFLSIEAIKSFTFAPELENSDYLVKKALNMGKIPSIGHSNAKISDFKRVYALGVRHTTHFPNAMSPLHHREIGLTGAGFYYDLELEVIADEVHSSKEFLKLLYKIKGNSFSLISDLIPQAFTNGEEKIIKDENGTLLGGATLVSEQIKLLKELSFSIEDIIKMASINNRKFFNLPIPYLREGEDASFLILDEDLNLEKVFFRGEKVYP